jgi:4-hydroxybenzoate polyprenyltransferase
VAEAVSRERPRLAATALLVRRRLSCIRYREILVLQGSPLLGAVFAMKEVSGAELRALAVFAVASVLLVAHIFMLNDWAGMSADLKDPNKAAGVFEAKGIGRREMGYVSVVLLVLSLLLMGLLGPRTLALAAAIAVLSLLYSGPASAAKGVPFVSSALHVAGGGLHFLLGYSLFSAIDERGMAIALFFALVFAGGHLNQEVRDHDGDRLNAIRTNAVTFGKRRTFMAGLVVFTLAYVQGIALVARGLLPRAVMVLAVLFPLHLYWSLETLAAGLTFQSIRRLQVRYRALFAIAGISMLAALLR